MFLLYQFYQQKVNLTNISITQLADQFIEFINNTKKINLEIASEYLLMATWLAYLKSKLMLPDDDDDEFKASEIAEKLKLQLKKLELIRLFSDQLLKKERLGVDVYMRGMTGGIRTSINSNYSVTLFELLKSYSNHIMRKNFLSYSYVLHKFCQLLELDHLLKHFPLLKSREKLHQQDKIWKLICRDLQWEYIPSI